MPGKYEESIYLLVNPGSGGKMGEQILNRLPNSFEFSLHGGGAAVIRSFSLIEKDGDRGKKTAFDEIKALLKINAGPVRVISAGGDGTIKWVVAEAQNHGVDPEKDLLIGVLPLGTGNDFSRYTGWGGKFPADLLDGELQNLVALARQWCGAKATSHDVWQVKVTVDEDYGAISKVNSKRTRELKKGKVLDETMIMYFDIGQGSKIGMGFDQRRTTNRHCNNFVYLWEGLKKFLPCRKRHLVADVVDTMYQGTDSSGEVIFDTDPDSGKPKLKSQPQILLFINIPSYSGGRADPWRGASRLGVTKPLDSGLKKLAQDPGDGNLEVVTMRNPPAVVLDKVLHKLPIFGARRVFSGAPIHVEFAWAEDDDLLSYCQVDGEFFKLINPSDVTITPSLKLQVLRGCGVPADEDDSSEESWSEDEGCSLCPELFGGDRPSRASRETRYKQVKKRER